jgi:acyl-CoA thioesterase
MGSRISQNVTGHFLLLAVTNLPFQYRVTVVRDGRRYVQRRVDVTQDGNDIVVFTCLCSFKTPEKNGEERMHRSQLEVQYKSVLENKPLDSFPEAPGVDSPL